MKAAIFTGSRHFSIEEVPFPQLEPDSVIVKVKAAGICGSDLHLYKNTKESRMIMGHEFSGDVVDIGHQVKVVKIGDRVTAMSGKGCGECYWCRQGQILRCQKLALLGYGVSGAFAEYVSVPSFKLGLYAARLAHNVSYEVGATAEPLSVGFYAINQVQPKIDDIVVVIGLGVIGLCIIRVLKAMGVTRIIASGRRASRLKLAKESGAEVVIDASKDDLVPIVNQVTSGKGADIVFECAGSSATYQQAFDSVHKGGKVNLVALYEQPVTWNPSFIVSKDISLIGCGLKWDIPGAVNLLQSGKVDMQPLITHEFPLNKIQEAFETQISDEDAVKVLVKP